MKMKKKESGKKGATSSVGLERFLDAEEVRGSNPLSPTDEKDVREKESSHLFFA